MFFFNFRKQYFKADNADESALKYYVVEILFTKIKCRNFANCQVSLNLTRIYTNRGFI